MSRKAWSIVVLAAGVVALGVSAPGCGSSAEPAASPTTPAAIAPPAGAVEKTPPPWLAERMKTIASESGEPPPTWGEWAIVTLAEAARAFATEGDIRNDPEWAAKPDVRVYVIIEHGAFENTRVGTGPPGYEGTPPPTVFPWYATLGEVSSRTLLQDVWSEERPDTSGIGQMYVYVW